MLLLHIDEQQFQRCNLHQNALLKYLHVVLGDIVGDICHSLHTNFITPHQPSPIFIPEPVEEKCQVEKCHFALNNFTL